jgi:hypothetical protein
LLVIGEVLSLLVVVARSWFVPRSRLQAEIMILPPSAERAAAICEQAAAPDRW